MRALVRIGILSVLCCVAIAAHAQSPRPQAPKSSPPRSTPKPQPSAPVPATQPQPTAAAAVVRPQFRPAVLTSGRDSLVNRINVNELLKNGQKDGAVQFSVIVEQDGRAIDVKTYHALPNCQALEAEVAKQLPVAKFTLPIYEHQPVRVLLYGTVLFDADEPPHLRILLNQDPEEIKHGSDFTSKGEMQAFQIASEEPPLLGLADAAVADFNGAKFIPAFRDGDPTDSESLMSLSYTPPGEEESESGLELGIAPPPPEP
jgi:hypothetical protein